MFNALHCEGFEKEEVALNLLFLNPCNTAPQDLVGYPQDPPTQCPQDLPPGEEVTKFAFTLDKMRRP
jgi:hypothetical protein